jgi:energy-coupling factor transporter ATP-binding protein EcfA2
MANKELGNIEKLSLSITEPIKMEQFEMDINNIMILVGQNGSGKTFILKMNWLILSQISFMIAARENNVPFNEELNLQFLVDNTYTKHGLEGKVTAYFKNGNNYSFSITGGKVQTISNDIKTSVKQCAQPVFMSKDTRTFEDICKYMQFKNMLEIPKGFPQTEEGLSKLLKMYRIYDIFFMEKLLTGIDNITEAQMNLFTDSIKHYLIGKVFKDFQVLHSSGDITYCDESGKDKSLTSLSSGEQSIINMMLANCI